MKIRKTLLVLSPSKNRNLFRQSADILRSGGLVVFPTETVYGLGANARDAKAVRAVFRAKGRPSDNPLIVHVPSVPAVGTVAASVPAVIKILLAKFAPGPLTVVLKKKKGISPAVTGGLSTVAVRIPSHPVAREFLKLCGVPVAAPSANRSGRPSPTTFGMARHEMTGRADAIISGGSSRIGLESTVIRAANGVIEILRPGSVTAGMIRKALGTKSAWTVVHAEKHGSSRASPGVRYVHYRPDADVMLFRTAGRLASFIRKNRNLKIAVLSVRPGWKMPPKVRCLSFRSVAEYGRRLFRTFHDLDRDKTDVILAQTVPDTGIGRAVRNRLEKASGGRSIG